MLLTSLKQVEIMGAMRNAIGATILILALAMFVNVAISMGTKLRPAE